MEFRPGTCSACKASFRIPASFTANMAKCSKCGGAVEIGPVTSDSKSADKPAVAGTAKAISAPVAGAAARLAAQPDAGAAQPVPAKPVTARPPVPAPKPAPVAPAKLPLPAAKPAAVAKPSESRPAMAKPAVAAAKPAPAPARVAAVAAKPAVKPAAPSRAKVSPDEDADDESRSSRRKGFEKKRGPNPLLIVGALVGVAIVGIGLFFAMQNFNAERDAKAEKAAIAKAEKTAKDDADRKALEAAALIEAAKPADAGPSKEVHAAESKPPADAPIGAEPTKPVEKEKPAAKPVEGYDLSTIPDFGPAEGTTPEQWTELQALAATMVDMSAGARSSKARDKLSLTPKQSFPAILNAFKKQDVEQEDGFRAADMTQKMLEKMCHGNNFGWRYQHEKDFVKWDQAVVKKWCDAWTKASTDEAYWNKLTKADAAGESKDPAGGDSGKKKDDDF